MISFDTFTGEAHGAIDEQRDGTMRDSDELSPHHKRRHNGRRSSRGRRSRRSETSGGSETPRGVQAPALVPGMTDDEHDFSDDARHTAGSDGRVHQLFQLLSLKNHTGDAKRALVQRLLGATSVTQLVLSKATEDQIASAANDAITDEILATVDQEDKRRQSESDHAPGSAAARLSIDSTTSATAMATATALSSTNGASSALVVASHDVGPYRVLELVDVLDSTTGGMVKRILTNVRRRQRGVAGSGTPTGATGRKTEFCGFCVDYRTHNTAQHKCRVCGALGKHRSQFCSQTKPPPSSTSSRPPTPRSGASTPRSSRRRPGSATPTQFPSASKSDDDEQLHRMADASPNTASRLTPDASDKSFCTFCGTWGFHSTENHRCRICGIKGEHRSRHCTKKSSGEGYRWRGSPAETTPERSFCDLCGSLRNHSTQEHRCRICLKLGEHRSKNCPMHTPTPPTSSSAASPAAASQPPPLPRVPSRGRLTPRSAGGSGRGATVRSFCSFCAKDVAHRSEEHICRICRSTGLHRSGDCPARGSRPPPSSSQSVLSYSVETASKVRDRVLESIPLVLPASASTLVMDSIDKVGDVDTILRRTLQRIGVWGGGSQTPITTPYAAPAAAASSTPMSLVARSRQPSVGDVSTLPALQEVDGQGVYVISYAEGRSVVPERILKYMRLLMHHEISTNAFSVVVVFDPRPSTWELQKPGMVTPRSLPSSPTMSEQLKKRMAKYTLQTLLGARDKLVKLVVAQKRVQQQQFQQLQQAQQQQPPHSSNGATGVQAAS